MMNINDDGVYLIDGTRTAIGAYGGSLAHTRPDDMAATIIRGLLQRHPAAEANLDEVVLGCANQSGEDNRNVARMATLLSGLDPSVPAITLNRLCASGLDAVIYAAAKIRSGLSELVLAGGVESMSRAPYVLSKGETPFDKGVKLYDTTLGWRFVNPRLAERYGSDPLGITAENVAQRQHISREEQDLFALGSQQKARRAIDSGRLAREITPVDVPADRKTTRTFAQDEFPRLSTLQQLQALKPASGINDGAAALLLASGRYVKRQGWQPLAEIGDSAAAGVEPALMGLGPIASTERLLQRGGFTLNDFDIIEINEAFASQVLAALKHWRIDANDARVNPNGGAIALGHPLGMSGARLVLSAALELRDRQASNALVTMCVGVGQGLSLNLKAV
jgi:acetyl-CoA acetyltransferase family protein